MSELKTRLYYVRLNENTLLDSESQVFTVDDLYSLTENAYFDFEKAKKDAKKYNGIVVQACFAEVKEGE